jgi:hypothetical protein
VVSTPVPSPIVPIRRRSPVPEEAARRFVTVAAHVDRAKASLLATVPSPRGVPGVPLPQALLAFEEALEDAAGDMAGWRTLETEAVWDRCRLAIEDALAAAERLRLSAPSLDYETLVTALGDLMDPLAAFEEAERLVSGRR